MLELVVDISSNNPRPLPWEEWVAAGVRGVVVKLTEDLPGVDGHYVNPFALEDIAEARVRGIGVAGYLFFHPAVSIADQVELVRQNQPAGLRLLWVDVEATDELQPAVIAAAAEEMLGAFGDGFPIVGGYFNLSELAAFTGAPWGKPLWLADPSHPAAPSVACLLHQFGQQTFGGAAVDMNRFLGTDAQFQDLFPLLDGTLASGGAPPPPARPSPPPVVTQPPPAQPPPTGPPGGFDVSALRTLGVSNANGPYVTGADVETIQVVLNAKGAAGLKVDSVYGNVTAGAVKNWQAHHGLNADGWVGPQTWPSIITE